MIRAITLVALVVSILVPADLVTAEERGIRRVDFRNYTYRPTCVRHKVRVSNGEHVTDRAGRRLWFAVTAIIYGDLTADGVEEAVVVTQCSTGGSGTFSEATIYGLRNNRPVEIATIRGGDRSYGGIHEAGIADGLVAVTRNRSSTCAICTDYLEVSKFRVARGRLVEVFPRRIEKEASRERIVLDDVTSDRIEYSLHAAAGQMMAVRLLTVSADAAFEVLGPSGDQLGGPQEGQWARQLEETGDYRIVVRALKKSARYEVEVRLSPAER